MYSFGRFFLKKGLLKGRNIWGEGFLFDSFFVFGMICFFELVRVVILVLF